MQKEIFFSIVIPTYNRAPLIRKTIDSFIKQTYPHFEILVVDDGSKDNTEEVMRSVTDPRVQYFKKNNEERGAARNYGMHRAKGDYVNFFDSDDLAYPNHLETAAQTIMQFSSPEIFHLSHDLKTPEGEILDKLHTYDGKVEDYAIKKKVVSVNSFFVRRDIAQSLEFSENRLLSASEDALYLCQLCARYTLHYNNTITSTIVEHDARSMVTATESQLVNRRKYLMEELKADKPFMDKYASCLGDINSEMSYLLCLSTLAAHENEKAYGYFKEYLKGPSVSIWGKRSLVFLKKWLFNIGKKPLSKAA